MLRYLLIVTGLLATGWIGFAVYFADSSRDQTSDIENSSAKSDELDTSSPDKPSEFRTSRIVGSDKIAAPKFDPSDLERIPAREPLSQPVKKRAADISGVKLLHRPVATAAGIFEAQGIRVQLAGIEPITPDDTCQVTGDQPRPCGKQALTAFRAWLRGRALECDFTEAGTSDPVEATCSLGGKDAAAWLVRNGWARSKERYAELQKDAKSNALGIFADNN